MRSFKVGFRGSYKNQQFKPKAPKGPVKLSFGLVDPKKTTEQEALAAVVPPLEPFPRQEIVGSLTLKGTSFDDAPPLPTSLKERILKNLNRVFQEGRFLNSKTSIEIQNNELHVSFSYDQQSIDRIKGLDRNERAWDPDLKIWRVFVGAFDDLLDILGRNVKISEDAFSAIINFVESPYYASVARGKLGKLIVRESWFEELDIALSSHKAPMAHGSNFYWQSIQGFEEKNKGEENDWQKLIQNFSFSRTPYRHQLQGLEYLLSNSEAALLDEMGCGKSFQIACSLAIQLKNNSVSKALIVAPMSLVKTWQKELSLAGLSQFTVIQGSPAQRAKLLESTSQIFIIHYEGLRLEEQKLEDWLKAGTSIMVLDESQRIKNLNAQTTTAALKLRPYCAKAIIATGTPIANRPLDLFSQYLFLDKGKTFGHKFNAFKNTFCEIDVQKIQVGRKTIRVEKFLGVKNSEELRNRILKTSLRRLKSEVLDLPPVVYKDYSVVLKDKQKTMYSQMRDHLKVEVSKLSSDQLAAQASTIMVKLLRLSQIASNPRLIDDSLKEHGNKISELEDLLEDIYSDDTKKVILWSHYVENVVYLKGFFEEKYGAVAHTGEMKIEHRQHSVSEFQDNPECRLFVATPQSAKEGLTLLPTDGKMKADTMIYLDLSFDSGSYVQSQARFHRIGQTAERCLVIHLVAEDTVDEYIRKSIVEKVKTAAELLDDGKNLDITKFVNTVTFSKEELLSAL
jgi:SNF2 family DNA or RNA helicase